MNGTINRPRNRLGRPVATALGLSLAIAAQAAPAGADGAETFHYGFRGQTAEATFYAQQGCKATETFVHAVDGRVKVGAGRPDAQSTLFVGVLRFDICTQRCWGAPSASSRTWATRSTSTVSTAQSWQRPSR